MNDDIYDIDDIERMLSPQCEFHASDKLKSKIMDEAETLSRPKIIRFAPWLAAACMAGVLVALITYFNTGNDITPEVDLLTEKVLNDTTQVLTVGVLPEEKLIAMAPATKTIPVNVHKTTNDIEVSVAPSSACNDERNDTTDTECAPTDADEATNQNEGAMPMSSRYGEMPMLAILTEAEIPVTNPENLAYTPEEIDLIRRQEDEAYLNRLQLMVEIAEHLVEENFKL